MRLIKSRLAGDGRWAIGLEAPPDVVAAGVAVHGHNGDEKWLLPNLWSLHLYRYDVDLMIDGVSHHIEPGCITIVPPAVSLHYKYKEPGEHCFVHFAESADRSRDSGDKVSLPALCHLNTAYEIVYKAFANAVASEQHAPYRMTAHVWDMLCGAAETAEQTSRPARAIVHPAVARAQELIEMRLGGTVSVVDVANEVDISVSYLSKLFRAAVNDTVAGYVIRRRASRAFHLLANTTMPIKAIAYSLGMPDLQQFNKTMRRVYGKSPRTIRGQGH